MKTKDVQQQIRIALENIEHSNIVLKGVEVLKIHDLVKTLKDQGEDDFYSSCELICWFLRSHINSLSYQKQHVEKPAEEAEYPENPVKAATDADSYITHYICSFKKHPVF